MWARRDKGKEWTNVFSNVELFSQLTREQPTKIPSNSEAM